jgi:uncharacterized membrane protein
MSIPDPVRIVIGPNASMTARQAWYSIAVLAAFAFAAAVFLAWRGFWPVLPFAGLEIGAFGAALAVSLRRNRYREVLIFGEDILRIEFGLVGRGAQSIAELHRGWTRVSLETGPYRNSPTRLLLSCFGQRVEIARCLTDEERERLASRLRVLTGAAWRSVSPTAFAAGPAQAGGSN